MAVINVLFLWIRMISDKAKFTPVIRMGMEFGFEESFECSLTKHICLLYIEQDLVTRQCLIFDERPNAIRL